MAPIGCIPYQKSINQLKDKQCVDLANKLALQYNARLKDLLMVELKDSLKDAHFVYANVYDLFMDLIVNFNDYGKNISEAHGLSTTTSVPLFIKTSTFCMVLNKVNSISLY